MKREKIYNWDTSHDTVDKLMIHHFVKGVELIVDWGTRQLAFLHNNRVIDQLPFPERYTVKDHTEIAYRTSAIANAILPFGRMRRARLKRLCHELRCM